VAVHQLQLGLAGAGVIARAQHVPALAQSPHFRLAGVADPRGGIADVPHFADLASMLADCPAIEAVSICTPPQLRHGLAKAALAAGKHVFLEKPPCATVAEFADLIDAAHSARRTLFAAWHSRHAAGVEQARTWLARHEPVSVRIVWHEDVRVWHPGQAWIWEPGGLGVFDPGINALSILTRILPDRPMVKAAELLIPHGRQGPIAAVLSMVAAGGAAIEATFDWRGIEPHRWDILVRTSDGSELLLSQGGKVLSIDHEPVLDGPDDEYSDLYATFAKLIEDGGMDADAAPLQLVADAFLVGRRSTVHAFNEE
jgi:predicted dehydrogenase